MPQPNLVPVSPNVSRSTQSRGVSGSTSTSTALPLTLSLITRVLPRLSGDCVRLYAGRRRCRRGRRRAGVSLRALPRPKDSSLSEISPKPPIVTEVVIIGAGPCGLFQVFELGLLGIGCHLVDSLGTPGGQCTELYPDKPIYDIPALPICGAQELVDRLMQQITPFNAPLHLGQEVTLLNRREDGRFDVETITGTRFDAGAVVIAGGVGSFQPRRLGPPGIEAFEGKTIHYRVRDAASYHGKKLAIFGGGDSALDWVMDFAGKAAAVTHIHRRADF